MPGGKESGSVRLWPKRARQQRNQHNDSYLPDMFPVEESPEKEMQEVRTVGGGDVVDGPAASSKVPIQVTSL